MLTNVFFYFKVEYLSFPNKSCVAFQHLFSVAAKNREEAPF